MQQNESAEVAVAGAVQALRQGSPVILPTDTVFGLAVAPRYADSPAALFQLKGRPDAKPVAWLVAGIQDLDNFGADVPAYARCLARTWWPGPLTLVVRANDQVPPAFASEAGTVGLRMPNDLLARQVMEDADSPLAATSANLSGRPAPQSLAEVEPTLRNQVAAVLDDAAPRSGVPSTVVDCTGPVPVVLREGGVSQVHIDAAVAAADATDQVACTSFSLASTDGESTLFARRWLPAADTPVRGIVLISHGMAEHAGRYDAFARFLAAHGLAVYAHDHVGHGRSVSDRALWGCLDGDAAADVLVEDIHELRKAATAEQPAGTPVILFGHSMGSFVARSYLARHGKRLAAAVISGTAQQPRILASTAHALATGLAATHGSRFRSAFLDGLGVGAYSKAVKPARTPYDWLSTDEAVVDTYMADPACGFMFSVGGYQMLMTLVGRIALPECAAGVPDGLPVLFTAGAEDPVGANGKGPRAAADAMRTHSHARVDVKIYPGMRHEILNETGYRAVWDDILGWIEEKGLNA